MQTKYASFLTLVWAIMSALAVCFVLFRNVFLTDLFGFDTFWHLAAGRFIYDTGTLVEYDPFCFSTLGVPWINTNWLSQLIIYSLFHTGNYPALRLFVAFFYIIAILAYLYNCKKLGSSKLGIFIGLAVLILAFLPAQTIRPRMVSFAFLSLLWAMLLHKSKASYALLVFLPLLFSLWIQLHGGVVYGGLLVLSWIFGRMLDNHRHKQSVISKDVLTVFGGSLMGLIGFAFNPQGSSLFVHLLLYSSRLGAHVGDIIELARPDYLSFPGSFAMILTVVFLLISYRDKEKFSWAQFLPLLVFCLYSLSMIRGISSFGILIAPVIAASFGQGWRPIELNLRWFTPVFTIMLVSLFCFWTTCLVDYPAQEKNPPFNISDSFIDNKHYPSGAAQFLRTEHPEGRVFNLYRYGGFLDWAFYLSKRVYIDGRGDLHGRVGNYKYYLEIVKLQDGWKEKLDKTEAVLLLFPNDHRLIQAALETNEWSLVYSDETNSVLSKRQASDL
jgi:MFS family permease